MQGKLQSDLKETQQDILARAIRNKRRNYGNLEIDEFRNAVNLKVGNHCFTGLLRLRQFGHRKKPNDR